ncbi:hypothetical protein AN189_00505 [Loktanella sp. 3ANDIMAR09]|uniref:flagellin n=1 Tax=Loktanella sp. 3ANDIMAR09 TaxID=1225657 RepID=UPI0006F74C20|nr:flagellin [Loktanella sp. 3ANDIMAR09]KQI69930.1 hypothetical protein AN189_00505 [Loktanella sp. 3ANDIMAR09]
MSSILTNNGAMVALQTLKSINSNLGKTQEMISTGKAVSSAKDNAAVWSISKQMDSDVKGFKAISESLGLGLSTVAVARNAAETVTDLLTDIKGKIVAAQEENVDRNKIQTDITALTDQIKSVVGAAQFNGLNLVDGSSTDSVDILSSLDRGLDGSVTPARIEVSRSNLSVTEPATAAVYGGSTFGTEPEAAALISGTGTTEFDGSAPDGTDLTTVAASGGTEAITIGETYEGASYQIVLDDIAVNVVGGGTTTGSRTFEYVASATDGTADVARNLNAQISAFFGAATDPADAYSVAIDPNDSSSLIITNGSSAGIVVGLAAEFGGTPGSSTATGGLGALATLDVTTDGGATGALAAIDDLIEKSIDAAASFGSAQGRIETQSNFISNLTDSIKSGIGTLVDANMEEASARLQALQVQQQLGVQSLSIANQAPQSILSLFR